MLAKHNNPIMVRIPTPNPKKRGINLTISEDELEDLAREAAARGVKTTTLATILYRRALRDLKKLNSLEHFVGGRAEIPLTTRFSAEAQIQIMTGLSVLFQHGNSEAIHKVIELIEKYATMPWSESLKKELGREDVYPGTKFDPTQEP
jgi:hypothetical protein